MFGTDAVPGDGVCATSTGNCPLSAAIQEANATPQGADITVPAGHYAGGNQARIWVRGDIRINPASPADVEITDTTFIVEADAALALTGINTSTSIEGAELLRLEVTGTASASRSVLEHVSIAPGGSVVLADSVVFGYAAPSVVNDGTLVAIRSSLLAHSVNGLATEVVLDTGPGATSHLSASVIARPRLDNTLAFELPGGGGSCIGTAPTLADFSGAEVPASCGIALPPMPAEVVYFSWHNGTTYAQIGFELSLDPTSPLVDAIPWFHPACDTSTVDLYGNPRGVDGNGDFIGGCDIGAIERQP